MKDGMQLKSVALLGRTFEEYCRYFQLQAADLIAGRILDIGSGVGGFCAEAVRRGYDVTAADPIYGLSSENIAQKSQADLDEVMRQLPGVVDKYKWTFYSNPEELHRYRVAARRAFLEDYSPGLRRYVKAALPNTVFRDKEFSTVLVSYFLFLYDDRFDYEFHKASILELARISRREIRIYPLTNLRAARSSYIADLMGDPACAGLKFHLIQSDFEFLKNSDQLLIIRPE